MDYYIHIDWGDLFGALIYPGFGFGGIQPSEFCELNLIQFNTLLNRFKVISSDDSEESQEIEEGHDPIDSDKLAGLSPKQLQKLLQKQVKDK